MVSSAATTILLFTCLILFIISFFLSGSKVAFFSMNSKDINLLKTKKQLSYRRVTNLLEQPKTLYASLLIANNFVNIGIILIANILMEGFFSNIGGVWAFSLKVIIIAFLLILFGEFIPKRWASQHKIWFASTSSLIVEIFNSVLFGMSKRFTSYSERIERKIGKAKSSGDEENNLDYEIDLLPKHEAGMEEKMILKGIRKFGDTTVNQIMRTRLDVSGIDASLTLTQLINLSEDLHYSRMPVYQSNLDEIIGILHIKDLLPYLNESADFNWHPLIRPPYFIHEQKLIEDLLQDFRNKRIHFAVVVDEFGGTSGIVTLEDIMEEVIGEIKDEFDDEESANNKIDDFNYIFEGKIMINDACKLMKISPHTFDSIRGESDSLAGLVLEIAGEFPIINQPFCNGIFTFIPLEIKKNRIEKIKVIIHPTDKNG
jgi:gliding motility-associated protein GldE